MPSYKIGIIGSGNLGFHLALAFSASGHRLSVHSKSGRNFDGLIGKGIRLERELPKISDEMDIIFLSVNDRSIEEVAKDMSGLQSLIVHNSGSTGMDILANTLKKNYGVLYPLQSFQINQTIDYQSVPFLIEADTQANISTLEDLVQGLGSPCRVMDSANRRKMHLAAVVVNNFSNHLYTLAENYLKEQGLSFELLLPLIRETAIRLEKQGAEELQTGPAKRGDQHVIDMHLDMLSGDPELKKLYEMMSRIITSHHSGR